MAEAGLTVIVDEEGGIGCEDLVIADLAVLGEQSPSMASTRRMRSYSFPSVTAARYSRSTNTGANSFTSLTRTCTVALRVPEQKEKKEGSATDGSPHQKPRRWNQCDPEPGHVHPSPIQGYQVPQRERNLRRKGD